jgi:D-threo-aldose 1-dehydrogenase
VSTYAEAGHRAAVRRRLGSTGLEVSALCLGTAGWATDRSDASDSAATAARFFDGPLNFIDTSNNYGLGESELRLGEAISAAGGRVPSGVVLQTKLDRDPVTNSFSGDRMRRSLDESLTRLGVDRLPLLYLHDPENTTFEDTMSAGGAVETLVAMRDEGIVEHIGISGGPVPMLVDYIDTGVFEVLITHSRFTLLDRSAAPLLDHAVAANVGVLNAAPFGGGLLSEFPLSTREYGYTDARAETFAAANAIGLFLEQHGIPLRAAALQWSTRDSRIDSTIVGALTPKQLGNLIALAEYPIGAEVWEELETLAPDRSLWLG